MTATQGHTKTPPHPYLYDKYPKILGQALAGFFNTNPMTDSNLNHILVGVITSHRSIQGYVLTICEFLIRGLAEMPDECIDPRNAGVRNRALLLWERIKPIADSRVRLANIKYHEGDIE